MKNKSGQNTIEYILLVVAVLTVLIVFFGQGGTYHKAMENSLLNSTVLQLQHVKDEIKF